MTDAAGTAAGSSAEGFNAAEVTPLDAPAVKKPYLLLLSCILLGFLFDLLFYGKTPGVSYPIFVAALYAVFFMQVRGRGREGPGPALLWIIPVVGLASTFALHANVPLLILNFLFIPSVLAAQTILFAGANRFFWFDPRFIVDILEGLFVRPFSGIAEPFRMLKEKLRERTDRKRYESIRRIATGLAVSLPLLVVVLLLLSSADTVFSHYLSRIPQLLGEVKLGTVLFRAFLVLAAALISFSYIYSFIPKTKLEITVAPPPPPLQQRRPWDPLTISTFLVVLNLVYIFFAVIQFSYLFGGGRMALPEGFTYAEYARQGFFELLVVTMINFVVYTLIVSFTGGTKRILYNLARFLLTLLAVSTLVMLISAFMRLFLYELAFGLTYARVTAHAFMIYIFILFIAAICRIWRESISLVKSCIAITILAYLVFNYAGVDRLISAGNIQRYFSTGKIDAHYLTRLSDDAVPQLAGLLEVDDQEISAIIENDLYHRKETLAGQKWQSFNWSRHQARQTLEGLDLQPLERIEPKP